MLKCASLYVYDIPSCVENGKVLGSLAFSERFQDSVIEVQRDGMYYVIIEHKIF